MPSRSEAVVELDAVAARRRPPQESPRGEFGIVYLVGEILGPCIDGPVTALQPDSHVEQRHGVARGAVLRIPPRAADVLEVEPDRAVELVHERLPVLDPCVERGTR